MITSMLFLHVILNWFVRIIIIISKINQEDYHQKNDDNYVVNHYSFISDLLPSQCFSNG